VVIGPPPLIDAASLRGPCVADKLAARERLAAVLAADVLDAIEELVDERVAAVLADVPNGSGSPWLALDEAADYLRVSPRTLERLIAKGRVRSTTLGRRRLLHRDDLDTLVSAAPGEDVEPTTSPRRREE
jgi:excisionase family DNA binding protein